MAGIKTNFIFNVILTLSSYVINLVIFPYVSRTLGVTMVGTVGFVTNTVNYFLIFSLMGISTVGIREIASAGADRQKRSEIFSSLQLLVLSLTAIVLVVYILTVLFIPQFRELYQFFIVGFFNILFTSLLVEWFYQGIEDFKFITTRSIFFKIIYAVCIFIFIKGPEDALLYYILTTLVLIINALINQIYSRKFVSLHLSDVRILKYFKPVMELGVYQIMVSLYTTINVIYLGFVCTKEEVGLYHTASKLFYIFLGIFTAFTAVMLPRMSALVAQEKTEEYQDNIRKSVDLVFIFALPVVFYCIFFAKEIIWLIAGNDFMGAVLPMQIILPMLLPSSLAQIFVMQVLMPMKKDRVVFISSCIGAFVGVTMNLLIVRQYGAVGSAMVLLFAVVIGDLYNFIYVLQKRLISLDWNRILKISLLSIPYIVLFIIIRFFNLGSLSNLILGALSCGVAFIIMYGFIIKDTFVYSLLNKYIKLK